MSLKIYLCAFLKKHYLQEALVCIESIRTKGQFLGQIFLLTDMPVENLEKYPDVEIIQTKCTSIQESASFRTRIFEYIKDFSENDIFLYLDTDIIITSPLPTFETINDKIHVYGYSNRTQKEESFAGFLTSDTNVTEKFAFCSGILLFRPSEKIKKIFSEIYSYYCDLITKKRVNACWEQPALCLTLIKHDVYEMSLNTIVHEQRSGNPITNSIVFNHFCGMRSIERHILMKRFLESLRA